MVDQGHLGTEDPHEEHSELLTQAALCWYGREVGAGMGGGGGGRYGRGRRGQVWEGEEAGMGGGGGGRYVRGGGRCERKRKGQV